MIRRYFLNLLIAIDQLLNTLAGGDPDETISSRIGKRTATCLLCRWFCALLNKIDPNHCKNSIENDEGGNAVIKGG